MISASCVMDSISFCVEHGDAMLHFWTETYWIIVRSPCAEG